jgi:pimeloyl-ACP methyl ester carboxylesterase
MDRYYGKVPEEILEQFKRFRIEHSARYCDVGGIRWEYLTSGEATWQPLLLLPGGLGTAESAWRTITALEKGKYFLICPGYPPEVNTMRLLADGIVVILKREEVGSAYVLGGSYGGMVAQVIVHRHPDLVEKLVLSHTYPPEKSRARSVESSLRLIRRLPMFVLRRLLRAQMAGILPANPSPELLLVAAQIHETVDTRMTRQAALSTYQRMIEYDQQEFTPADLDNWQGKTLIILAEDDPTTPEYLRKELFDLYPGAKKHLFKGGSHATPILESEEYIKVVEDFFSDMAE